MDCLIDEGGNNLADEVLIKVEGVTKVYQMGEVQVPALKNVDLEVLKGEFLVILGPSGSGKSTLLNIIGGMDLPTEGNVIVDGDNIMGYNDKELTHYRRNKIGFVFQFYNLMGNLTARENVELATEICKNALDVDEVLETVGLGDRKDHFPSQMSGGEQQRVAIARAVAKNSDLLLCDEPTGALDFETGIKILSLLRDINRKYNKTVIIIVDGDVKFDAPPIVKDGRTLIPVRTLAEGFGASVEWVSEEQKVTISKGETNIVLHIDSNIAVVNGQEVEIDVASTLYDGRTYVPLRFIAETLGLYVNYDEETGVIEIGNEEEIAEEPVVDDTSENTISN